MWNTHLKKRPTKNSDHCHKTESKENKTNYSASPSCTSSSITSAGEQNVEKALGDPGLVQEVEVKKPNDKSEFIKVKCTHPSDHIEAKENSSSNSPTSSYASNFSNSGEDNKPKEALEFSKADEVMNPDDGKIEIPLESDIDFWELFDSLDPLRSDKTEENEQDSNPAEKLASGIECSKWLRFLENELGLTSDVDHLPKDQNIVPTAPQYQEMNLEPEIGPGLDYFPIWPSSPQNLGI